MKENFEKALRSIADLIDRCEKAKSKFFIGSSQYTLQKNRIEALSISLSLIKNELCIDKRDDYSKNDLQKALAPITSLISKSEKVQQKLAIGTWQHKMTENNLKALYIALSLLQKEISKAN